MRSIFGRRGGLILLVLLALAAILPAAAAAQQDPGDGQGDSELVGRLEDDGAKVLRHSETGEVRFVGASKDDPVRRPAGLAPDASPEEAARAHLAVYGKLFGIADQARELRAEEAGVVGEGRASARFQQLHKGVPVLGGEINVQLDGENNLLVATGEITPGLDLDVEPGVGADEARDQALGKIAKDRELEAGDLEASDPELSIFDPSLLGGPSPRVTSLVWRLEVTPEGESDHFNELVFVDAATGAVLLNFDQIHNVRNRNTHDANNTTALPGALVCNEANPCADTSLDEDVRLAHRYAGNTYDFYSNNHGRDSLDDAGMTLVSTADHCDPNDSCPTQNAAWNGTQMWYGDGFAAADDVVGHELTHGVTDFESRLFYYYQSGAINESLSDVWGEFVDLTNGSGTDTAAVRWQMGEDIPGIGAIRDMENPGAFGDPDRMLSPNYHAAQTDSGGVHINSGVNNKAAFLMTDGGTFNGKTVTGLGITKVAKIYYEAQTNLLTSASDYQDLHSVLRQACANLTGTAGITSADCAEVKDAVDATQMNLIPTAAPNPEAPVCNTGQTATNLFNDNMENTSSGNWATQTLSGSNAFFYPQNSHPFTGFDATYATSGTTNIWGYDQASTSDFAIARTGNVTPPAGTTTYLRFRHAYGFENGASTRYDGGVLEYSTNNGSTWTDAGSLITNNGYNGAISSGFGNPLGGRQAFTAQSNGYISSRVNLSSLAGQSVRFRFRIGTDSSVDDFGWFIDDVQVYTCGSDTTKPRVLNTSPTAQATGVAPGTNVLAVFSEPMRASTITRSTFTLRKQGTATNIGATVTYDPATRRATLNPNSNLQRGATYIGTITTATRDLAGNPLDQLPTVAGNQDKTWKFTVTQ